MISHGNAKKTVLLSYFIRVECSRKLLSLLRSCGVRLSVLHTWVWMSKTQFQMLLKTVRKKCEEYKQFLLRDNICSKYFALIRKLVNFVQMYLFGHGLLRLGNLKADFNIIRNHGWYCQSKIKIANCNYEFFFKTVSLKVYPLLNVIVWNQEIIIKQTNSNFYTNINLIGY